MKRNDREQLMTAAELAAYLNLAEKTIRNRVSAGTMPYLKVGPSLRFRRKEIDQWIETQTARSRTAA